MSVPERQLALWLAEGHAAGRIAEWLGCCVRTVRTLVADLLAKFPMLRKLRSPSGVRHRTRAASQCGSSGLDIDSL